MIVKDWWWDEDDFIIITETGEEIHCKNAYLSDIKFGELEYASDETVYIEQKERYKEARDCE